MWDDKSLNFGPGRNLTETEMRAICYKVMTGFVVVVLVSLAVATFAEGVSAQAPVGPGFQATGQITHATLVNVLGLSISEAASGGWSLLADAGVSFWVFDGTVQTSKGVLLVTSTSGPFPVPGLVQLVGNVLTIKSATVQIGVNGVIGSFQGTIQVDGNNPTQGLAIDIGSHGSLDGTVAQFGIIVIP